VDRLWDAAILSAVLGAIVTGVFALLAAVLGAFINFRKELEAEYDKDLRKLRIEVFKPLWRLLQPLAFYGPPGPVTYRKAEELSRDLRQWYYEVGGLFLSSRQPGAGRFSSIARPRTAEGGSRGPYFALQEALQEVVSRVRQADIPLNDPLPDADLTVLKANASALRTSLTLDVGTRRGSEVGAS